MKYYTFSQNMSLNLLPKIDEINFCHHINSFDWPIEHTHTDYWEFTIVTNGAIVNCVNGAEKTYEAGTVFAATSSDCHSLKAKDGQPVRYITLLVKEPYIRRLFLSLDLSPDLFNDSENRLTLSESKINEIEGVLRHIDPMDAQKYREYDKLLCSVLLILLSAAMSMENFQRLEISSWQQMLAALSQSGKLLTLDVNNLCRELGYSRTRLNALFKNAFGLTPHEYLVNYKLMNAKNLLLNTKLSIAEIAAKVGFSGTMRFYVNFEKMFGRTPAAFRERRE